MSRNSNPNGGYFKDLGNLSTQFFNQIASDIRNNAEQIVSAALQNEACRPRGVHPESGRSSRASNKPSSTSSSSASTPSGGPRGPGSGRGHSSTSSSQATTPDEQGQAGAGLGGHGGGAGEWFNQVRDVHSDLILVAHNLKCTRCASAPWSLR